MFSQNGKRMGNAVMSHEEWLSASAEFDDGSRKIYSVRLEAPEAADPEEYNTVVVLEWSFEDELPDARLLKEMEAFEELLDPLDDMIEHSFLVHVITGDGVREWCYYTRSHAEFIADLNRLLAGHKHFPIDIEYQEHTDWSYWEEIRDFVQDELIGTA